MPLYSSTGAKTIYPDETVVAYGTPAQPSQPSISLTGETLTVNGASQQFVLPGNPSQTDEPTTLSCELTFSATPGVFEIDIQDADTDLAANYILVLNGGQISSVNAGFVARSEFQMKGKFFRLNPVTWPNASVTCIAKFFR